MLCVQLGLAVVGRAVRPASAPRARPGCGWSGRACCCWSLVRPRRVGFTRRGLRGLRRARRGHRGAHPAVHGGGRAAAARHGQRAGVPRAARRRGGPRPRRGPAAWPALAAVGVLLLTEPWHGARDPVGVAFALAAAGCWAAYILLTQRVGDEVAGITGLAVSMPVAALVATAVVGPARARPADPGAAARSGSAWPSCCRSSRSPSSCSRCGGSPPRRSAR